MSYDSDDYLVGMGCISFAVILCLVFVLWLGTILAILNIAGAM